MPVPSRRSIRLSNFDYSTPGAYFVTICTHERACLFGDVVVEVVRLNGLGEIVQRTWADLPKHFPQIELDQFVIMPNHVHGIVVLNDIDARTPHAFTGMLTDGDHNGVGAQFIAPVNSPPNANAGAINRAPTIGEIVRGFKARCTYTINHLRLTPGHPVWQRNYYEHVIRDDRDLAAIREYIAANPNQWHNDENYPERAIAQARNR